MLKSLVTLALVLGIPGGLIYYLGQKKNAQSSNLSSSYPTDYVQSVNALSSAEQSMIPPIAQGGASSSTAITSPSGLSLSNMMAGASASQNAFQSAIQQFLGNGSSSGTVSSIRANGTNVFPGNRPLTQQQNQNLMTASQAGSIANNHGMMIGYNSGGVTYL